jgi:hypothetical protein
VSCPPKKLQFLKAHLSPDILMANACGLSPVEFLKETLAALKSFALIVTVAEFDVPKVPPV